MTRTMSIKRTTLASLLRAAADQYNRDATIGPRCGMSKQTAEQYRLRAREAAELADLVMCAEQIKLEA